MAVGASSFLEVVMALPTARTPGFTTFQTRWGPRTTCECLAQWLPAFARRLGVSVTGLQITQLTGGASASAGTHSQGGAADLLSTNREWVRIAREMGAAAWVRTRSQGFDVDHIHLVLNGCPHNGPARYQVNALAAGFNGLGSGGRGGRDDGPGPQKLRTWSQGIAWALGVNADSKPPTSVPEGDATMLPIRVNKKHWFTVSHGKVTHWPSSLAKHLQLIVNVMTVEDKGHDLTHEQFNAVLLAAGVPITAVDGSKGVVRDSISGEVGPGNTWSRDDYALTHIKK